MNSIKNLLKNGYALNWSEEVFVISKVKNTVPWTYVISNLIVEIDGTFYEKNCRKQFFFSIGAFFHGH